MPLRSDFPIEALTPEPPNAEDQILKDQSKIDLNLDLETQALFVHDFRKRETRRTGRRATRAQEREPGPRRVAFLVTHGMGQQVPFETVSMLGQALITQHGMKSQADTENIKARLERVRLTDQPDAPELSRVEVTLTDENGKDVEVHLYESYWAPFTEGQISFLATVKFLYLAALRGIWTAIKSKRRASDTESVELSSEQKEIAWENKKSDGMKHFDRWMFGCFRDMPIKKSTFWILAILVGVLTIVLLPSLVIFTSIGLSAAKSFYQHFGPTVQHLSLWWQILGGVIALIVIGIALFVRYFVIEYVGDVAIYVSSYKVSRYDEIRSKILNQVFCVARQIYSAGIADDEQVAYDDVVIVGHSLGSVISYDLLNWCINWDEVENKFRHKVVGRTTRLITFGSPLDKTAFLFRTQVSSARNLREALAARQQPLILNYQKFRPKTFKWINIFSRRDIISGSLEYYDVAGLPGYNKVENLPDPEARTPLMAHVQYWKNNLLHQELYKAALAGTLASAGKP